MSDDFKIRKAFLSAVYLGLERAYRNEYKNAKFNNYSLRYYASNNLHSGKLRNPYERYTRFMGTEEAYSNMEEKIISMLDEMGIGNNQFIPSDILDCIKISV